MFMLTKRGDKMKRYTKLTDEVRVAIQKDIDAGMHPIKITKKYKISPTLLYQEFDVRYRENKQKKIMDEIVFLRKQRLTQDEIGKRVKLSGMTVRRYLRKAEDLGLIEKDIYIPRKKRRKR